MLFAHVPQCAADRKPRLHIVGHSLGAMLALELSAALLQQDSNISVASLTLMATPYFTDRSQAESSASNHSFWFRNQWLATTCCGYLVCRQNWLWQRALRRKFAREFPQLPHAALVGGLSHTHHGIKSSIESVVLDHRADAAVQQICVAKIPTLLIDSDADKLCIESQRQLREIFSNLASKYTYAVTLKGAKHGFIVHNYAEVTDHLQSFIETLVKTTFF
jgi:pimeloyl-ACP methyl ester carboxylesterase